jgi:integrase
VRRALWLPQADVEGRTVEISATGPRDRERPKTRALFPSPIGLVRDSSKTPADLRRALDDAGKRLGVEPHVPHHATRLDDAGVSHRQIADHLGHGQPRMTQHVYRGRMVANTDDVRVLDR